jgi:hypothetical protein
MCVKASVGIRFFSFMGTQKQREFGGATLSHWLPLALK